MRTNKKKQDLNFVNVPVQKGPEALPHDLKAEKLVLGCIMKASESDEKNPMVQVDEFLRQLDVEHFFHVPHRQIVVAMKDLRANHTALSTITLNQWKKKNAHQQDLPGLEYMSSLHDGAMGDFWFPEGLKILEDYRLKRLAIERGQKITALGKAENVSLETMKGILSDMLDDAIQGSGHRGELKIWRVNDLMKYEPPEKLQLVGDNEVRMGVEGLTLLAGPGGSGKSMALTSLAVAGAVGHGMWMGRKVHRKFRTLFIQAENGAGRLKKEIKEWTRNYPKLNLQDHVIISDPPEGGIPFHRPEFRANLRRRVDELKPDLLVLDPWSHIAVEDQAKEVVDKIAEIRSCLPAGDDCPGVIIATHTKKPRAEDIKKGRALVHQVSGTVALTNTARCVYMLLPWDDDTVEKRVYFTCAKLNDGEMYAATVWIRTFGNFFQHDPDTDASTWGDKRTEEGEQRRGLTLEMFQAIFEKAQRPSMHKSELVKMVANEFDVSEQTIYRALHPKSGYATPWFLPEAAGMWALHPDLRTRGDV